MMTNDRLTEVACPNCRNPIDLRLHNHFVTCDACGSQFVLQGHLCPNCGAYNEEKDSVCGQCSAALTRICRKCSTVNWAGDEYCQKCGNAMDILDLIAGNYAMTTADRLLEQRHRAQEIKEIEELASNKRMEELMAIENARQVEVRRRMEVQRRQERKLYIMLAVGIGLFVLILLFYGIISLL